ncbi:MAG: phosphatase PAP2 family protein [bacterium]|nr:phosphatase PAP2 family protein [bacterium]
MGGDLCETFLMSSGTVWAAKVAFSRRRPSGGPHSFPSGHTAVAFSVVPVIAHHFGWRAAVPAVLLASATGLGRMEAFRHFQSDVLAGAALGLACGDIVAGAGFLPGRAQAVVLPDGVGVSIPF